MADVSVIIPARNEIYLQRTIENILKNARSDIEIIAILDGYEPNPPITINDPRVKFIHNKESIGQRASINQGARQATGKYFMKLDAHCAVDEGFDIKLMADCEPDWTVIPRMYNLNSETWEPKLHKRTDYMYIGCDEGRLLRAEYYKGKEFRRWHDRPELIDDTMACMGPCFFMTMDRFWELGGCDEGHIGGWGQQGCEVACKAYLSGGSLKVNKKTWFAHWFRGGGGPGFPYPISGRQVERVRQYSRDLWLNNKWPKQKRKFEWLIEKFNPPGWEGFLGDLSTIEKLRDRHKDKICYIIGTGEGMQKATSKTFIPDSPIIAINMAGKVIESLKLDNPIYSMQKDGESHGGPVFRPEKATLLVSQHESLKLFEDYPYRFVFNAITLCQSKHGANEFSAICALKVAQILGCTKIKLIGFDAYWGKSNNIYDNSHEDYANKYAKQIKRMLELIRDDKLEVEWIQ